MKGIIGRKVGMTRLFDENHVAVPVTVILAGPCVVTAVKTADGKTVNDKKDGYDAIQLGFEEVKVKEVSKELPKGAKRRLCKLNKAELGKFKKAELTPMRILRELRVENPSEYKVGQVIDASVFEAGQYVDVIGTSIGKGFAGPMKRHHFNGGPRTHGSMSHRKPCSGGATDAARTIKGSKRGGHLGAARVTTQGLKVFRVEKDNNLILVRGAVPGPSNGIVVVRTAKKHR